MIEPSQYKLICMDCANNIIMDDVVILKRDEYERLKLKGERLRSVKVKFNYVQLYIEDLERLLK